MGWALLFGVEFEYDEEVTFESSHVILAGIPTARIWGQFNVSWKRETKRLAALAGLKNKGGKLAIEAAYHHEHIALSPWEWVYILTNYRTGAIIGYLYTHPKDYPKDPLELVAKLGEALGKGMRKAFPNGGLLTLNANENPGASAIYERRKSECE